MADRIVLEGLQLYGYHGVSDEERVIGHRFEVDLEVECDLRRAGASDDVADTIDYGELAQQVMRLSRERQFKLIEAFAAAIAAQILATHAGAAAVRVRVRKLLPPIDGIVTAAAVEIERSR
jgi:dihydroneopterin aldolase